MLHVGGAPFAGMPTQSQQSLMRMHWLGSVHSGTAAPEEDALVDDDVLVDDDALVDDALVEEVVLDVDDVLDDVVAPPPAPPGPAPPPGLTTLLPHAATPAREMKPRVKQSRARIGSSPLPPAYPAPASAVRLNRTGPWRRMRGR